MIWKQIPGYENLYWAGKNGQIKSLRGIMKGYRGNRYYQVCLSKGDEQRTHNVHSLIITTFKGAVPKGMQINHKDGNKQNSKLSNLEVTTPSRNNIHALRTGLRTIMHGSKWHRSKIKESDVKKIRILLTKGVSQYSIANKFGINQSTISDIKTGRCWSRCE